MAVCNCTGACRGSGGCRCSGVLFGHLPFVLTTESPFHTIVGDFPYSPTGQPIPQDDPQSPVPSPLAGAWQCPGCGTIYSYLINKCECQRRDMTSSSASTNGTFTTELP